MSIVLLFQYVILIYATLCQRDLYPRTWSANSTTIGILRIIKKSDKEMTKIHI